MDDGPGMDVVVSVDDLVHERDGLGLRDGATAGDHLSEVPAIAEFGDDVGVVFGVIDVVNFYDVIAVFECF